MKKTLCLMMALLLLILAGCSDAELPQETPEPTITPTATPAPQHSELYHPDYSLGQIMEYFNEVVLDAEYSDGTGDISLVQKWTGPIYCALYGNYTDEDLSALADLFGRLNSIPGFPGIYPAGEGRAENMSISFLEPDALRESFYDVVSGEYVNGAVQFWYYTDTNVLHTARIGCSTAVEQSQRNSIIIEEIINALGITDTVLREDSVVYQYSDENTALSQVDEIILKLLYAPEIQPGMDKEACAAVIEQLYY